MKTISTTSYVMLESNATGPTIAAFLCRDDRFRDFAWFGTYSSCVKQYKTVGHALNTAKKRKWKIRHTDSILVMTIDWTVANAAGDDNFYMNGNQIIWKGVKKTYPQLIADAKNGVANGFPVTFTFLQ